MIINLLLHMTCQCTSVNKRVYLCTVLFMFLMYQSINNFLVLSCFLYFLHRNSDAKSNSLSGLENNSCDEEDAVDFKVRESDIYCFI